MPDNEAYQEHRGTLLDLFCGAGGAAAGYARAGFKVIGVDIKPQPRYPFRFYALDWKLGLDMIGPTVDVIHASPPCQRFSEMHQPNRHRHPNLIGPVRSALRDWGGRYVIENTPRAPLVNPIILCGSMFGLGVRRHRLFESNQPLKQPECDHAGQPKRYRVYDHGKWYWSSVAPVYGHGGGKAKEMAAEAMQIGWMTRAEIVEAIPPAYTEFVGNQL